MQDYLEAELQAMDDRRTVAWVAVGYLKASLTRAVGEDRADAIYAAAMEAGLKEVARQREER